MSNTLNLLEEVRVSLASSSERVTFEENMFFINSCVKRIVNEEFSKKTYPVDKGSLNSAIVYVNDISYNLTGERLFDIQDITNSLLTYYQKMISQTIKNHLSA